MYIDGIGVIITYIHGDQEEFRGLIPIKIIEV